MDNRNYDPDALIKILKEITPENQAITLAFIKGLNTQAEIDRIDRLNETA